MLFDVNLYIYSFFPKSVNCQGKNIMHYIMLQTVPTKDVFKRVTTYKQSLSYHERKFYHDHLVV